MRSSMAEPMLPSDTVASESSPEPARGQLKPLLPGTFRRQDPGLIKDGDTVDG